MPREDRKAFVRCGDKIFKVQRTRHRRVLACRLCHGRKIKCCMTRPTCSNCTKGGLSCEYFDNTPKMISSGPSPPHSLPSDQSLNTSPSSSSSLDEAKADDQETATKRSLLKDPKSKIESFTSHNRIDSPAGKSIEGIPTFDLTNTATSRQSQNVRNDIEPGESEVVNRLSNSLKIESPKGSSETANSFLNTPKLMSSMTFPGAGLSGSPSSIEKPMSKSMFDRICSNLPSFERCVTLLDRYSNAVHPIIPILNTSELIARCELLHEDVRVGREPDMSYLPLLFAVLYAASVSLYEDATVTNDDPQVLSQLKIEIHRFVGIAETCLTMIHFPREPSLLGCTVAVILYSVCRNDCKTEDTASLAVLIRVAQLMGLHKDPIGKNSEVVQKRRILWWHLVYLDTVSSLSSGLSPLIQPEECTTQLPPYENKTNDQYLVLAIARFQWAQLAANIIRTLNRPLVENTVNGLRTEINGFGRAMDLYVLNFQTMFSDSSYCDWVSHYINTLDCRLCILLDREMILRRLRRAPNTSSVPDTDLTTAEIYDRATVKNAIKFLNNYRVYANPDQFANFIWEIKKFQPLQAILILLGAYAAEPNAEIGQCLDLAFRELRYLGKKTSNKCIERWNSMSEHWKAASKNRKTAGSMTDFDVSQFLDWIQESMTPQTWDMVSGDYIP